MFHVVNTYTKAFQMDGLPAESSYRLLKVGGEVLEMSNLRLNIKLPFLQGNFFN